MSKIKQEVQPVWTTTDERTFTLLTEAEAHQLDLDRKNVIKNLTEALNKMFRIPTQKEIDDLNDKASDSENDEEREKFYDKAEKTERTRDHFFDSKCSMFYHDYVSEDIAQSFVDLYKEFGFVNLKKILVFIAESLED